jgi:hypothetical protein
MVLRTLPIKRIGIVGFDAGAGVERHVGDFRAFFQWRCPFRRQRRRHGRGGSGRGTERRGGGSTTDREQDRLGSQNRTKDFHHHRHREIWLLWIFVIGVRSAVCGSGVRGGAPASKIFHGFSV